MSYSSFANDLATFQNMIVRYQCDPVILDLGAGSGELTNLFLGKGIRVVAAEPDRVARDVLICSLRNGICCIDPRDTEALARDGEMYDGVLAVRSLNHGSVEDVKAALLSLSRLVNRGGYLFLYVATDNDFRLVQGKRVDKLVYEPLDGPEKGIQHVFFSFAQLIDLLEPQFAVVHHRIDEKCVPTESAYFEGYSQQARDDMIDRGLVSSHHVFIAKRTDKC